MNILVTGASGFIGSYLCQNSLRAHSVQTFSFRKDDLNELDLSGIDVVIHLSALVHQMGGAEASAYQRINVDQTEGLAKRSLEFGVKHFIFMSTVKVYGEENKAPYTEESACEPLDDYGKSKLEAERILRNLETGNFIVSAIRTPLVYGYGVKANVSKLMSLVKKFPALPLSGIKNKRSMVYVGNLCALVQALVDKRSSGIFIASDDQSVSTSFLVRMIAKEMGLRRFVFKLPFLKTFLRMCCPGFYRRLFLSLEVDNTWTKSTLGFSNPYSIERGIHYMINGEDPATHV